MTVQIRNDELVALLLPDFMAAVSDAAPGLVGPQGPAGKDATTIQMDLTATTLDDSPAEMLQGSNHVTIPVDTSWSFHILVTAATAGMVEVAGYELVGLVRNLGGAASMVGSVTQRVLGESDASWDATADANGNTLRVLVTGAAAVTVKWAARVQMALLTFPAVSDTVKPIPEPVAGGGYLYASGYVDDPWVPHLFAASMTDNPTWAWVEIGAEVAGGWPVKADPHVPTTLYTGVVSALARTLDAPDGTWDVVLDSSIWTPLVGETDLVDSQMGNYCPSPAQAGLIYATIFVYRTVPEPVYEALEYWVLVSTDSGATWAAYNLSVYLPDYGIDNFAPSFLTPDLVFVWSYDACYKSTDGCQTLSKIFDVAFTDVPIGQIIQSPLDDEHLALIRLQASGMGALYDQYSDDGGATWTPGAAAVSVNACEGDHLVPGTIYKATTGSPAYLMVSTDYGATYTSHLLPFEATGMAVARPGGVLTVCIGAADGSIAVSTDLDTWTPATGDLTAMIVSDLELAVNWFDPD